jgi:hypothetical protein
MFDMQMVAKTELEAEATSDGLSVEDLLAKKMKRLQIEASIMGQQEGGHGHGHGGGGGGGHGHSHNGEPCHGHGGGGEHGGHGSHAHGGGGGHGHSHANGEPCHGHGHGGPQPQMEIGGQWCFLSEVPLISVGLTL